MHVLVTLSIAYYQFNYFETQMHCSKHMHKRHVSNKSDYHGCNFAILNGGRREPFTYKAKKVPYYLSDLLPKNFSVKCLKKFLKNFGMISRKKCRCEYESGR